MSPIRTIYGKLKFLLLEAQRGTQASTRELAQLLVSATESRLEQGESDLPFSHFGRGSLGSMPVPDSYEAVRRAVSLAVWIGLLDESGKVTPRAQRSRDFDNLMNRLVNEKFEGRGGEGLEFNRIVTNISQMRIPDFDAIYESLAGELPHLTREQVRMMLNLKVATGNLNARLRRMFLR